MRIAIIFLTLTITSFIIYGLGWQEVGISLVMAILLSIGASIGIVMAGWQDIKEIKK